MILRAVKTDKIVQGRDLTEILDRFLPDLSENTVVVITSKVVSICEGRLVPRRSVAEDELIKQEADYVLPENMLSKYIPLTIKDNTLIPAAGIDRSNSSGDYVLWPQNSQKTANEVRSYLKRRFKPHNIGVIITDSSAIPLRFGTIGVPLAYSGFSPFKDYKGQKDLFGFPLMAGRANIAGALAAAAVAVMGEGTEQTPITLISDVPFVEFRDSNPAPDELQEYFVPPDKDRLFEPFFKSAPWQRSDR
ncbi:MAG TPA: coenzyme F420-0:L-glutamate ligase [Candidatus Saccharimonadales bacterium]|nr:coenzyme F420-0:L-glutamate ligase [Candidatus Saccharimonadales bacterium]